MAEVGSDAGIFDNIDEDIPEQLDEDISAVSTLSCFVKAWTVQ